MNYILSLNKLKTIYNPFDNDLSINLLLDYVINPVSRKLDEPPVDDKDKLYKNLANYIINSDSQKLITIDLNSSNPIVNGYFEYVKSIFNNEKNIYISIPDSNNNLDVNNIFVKKLSTADNIIPYSDSTDTLLINENFSFESSIWNTAKDIYTDIDNILPHLFNYFESYFNTKVSQDKNIALYSLSEYFKKIPEHIFEDINVQSKIIKENYNFYFSFLNKHVKFDFNDPLIINSIESLFSKHDFDIIGRLHENKLINQSIIDLINKKENSDYLILDKYYYSSSFSNNSFTLPQIFSYLSDENQKNPLYLEKYIQSHLDKNMNNNSYLRNTDMIALFDMSILNPDGIKVLIPFYNNKKINTLKSIYINDPIAIKNIENFNNMITLDFFKNNTDIAKYSFDYADNFYKSKDDVLIDDVKFFIKNQVSYSSINEHPLFKNFHFDLELAEFSMNSSSNFDYQLRQFDFKKYIHYFSETNNPALEKFKSQLIIANRIADTIHLYEKNSDKSKIIFDKYCIPEYLFITEKDYSFFNMKYTKQLSTKNLSEIAEIIIKMKTLEFSKYEINYRHVYNNVNKKLKTKTELLDILNYKVSFSLLPQQLQYNKKVLFNYLVKSNHIPDNLLNYLFTDKQYLTKFFSMVDSHTADIDKAPTHIQKFFINNNIKENYLDFFNKYLNYVDMKQSISNTSNTKNTKIKL